MTLLYFLLPSSFLFSSSSLLYLSLSSFFLFLCLLYFWHFFPFLLFCCPCLFLLFLFFCSLFCLHVFISDYFYSSHFPSLLLFIFYTFPSSFIYFYLHSISFFTTISSTSSSSFPISSYQPIPFLFSCLSCGYPLLNLPTSSSISILQSPSSPPFFIPLPSSSTSSKSSSYFSILSFLNLTSPLPPSIFLLLLPHLSPIPLSPLFPLLLIFPPSPQVYKE